MLQGLYEGMVAGVQAYVLKHMCLVPVAMLSGLHEHLHGWCSRVLYGGLYVLEAERGRSRFSTVGQREQPTPTLIGAGEA